MNDAIAEYAAKSGDPDSPGRSVKKKRKGAPAKLRAKIKSNGTKR
jgi:hypothetical protein